MKKLFLSVLFGLFLCDFLEAQKGNYLVIGSWNINFPTADTHDFLNDEEVSLAGASLENRYFFSDRFTGGIVFGWDFFNGFSNDRFSGDNIDITGDQFFFLNYFQFQLNAHYYLNQEGSIRPFIGAGLGMVRTLQRTSISTFNLQNNNFHFGFFPELGALVPLSDKLLLFFSSKDHVALKTDSSITYSYASVRVGLAGLFSDSF